MSTATMHIPAEDAELLRLPDPSGYTVDDLHALPDDGRRYELIDGNIIVSPSATVDHNIIARWIANEIEKAAPAGLAVGTDQSATVDRHNQTPTGHRRRPIEAPAPHALSDRRCRPRRRGGLAEFRAA